MDSLRRDVMAGFGQGSRPNKSELVLLDGFDYPQKGDAVRFYSGKTWQDVLAHLRGLKDEPLFRAAYFFEEWAVLSPPALAYYARAHLEFLFETLAGEQPDQEFVFYLLGQLHQVVFMHKGSPFNAAQTILLRRVVQMIAERAAEPGIFEEFTDDIKDSAERVLVEMKER